MSRTRAPRDLRVAHGWLLAITTALLSVCAHAAADGMLPDPAMALTVAGLAGWISTSLVDRSRATRTGGVLGILLTLAGAQLVIHFSLTWLAPPHAQHAMHAMPGGLHLDSPVMLAAHGVATLILAVLIGGAERGLLAVLAGLRRVLPTVIIAGPHPSPPTPAVMAAPEPSSHTEILFRRLYTRRGPPADVRDFRVAADAGLPSQ